jgi:hypothetical protein
MLGCWAPKDTPIAVAPPAAGPSNRHPRSATVGRRTDGQTDRRSRAQRWDDTVAGLVALQAEHVAWHEALPETLRDSATAEALQAIVDLDLDALIAIVPPRGYGRD